MNPDMRKYPRTPHLEGSRFQPGDEDLDCAPFSQIAGRYLVVEEKVDGANAGISFAPDGALLLQSRGHYLTGGPREKHFALLKTWAQCHRQDLWDVLGSRYILYGEWLYAKHTVFYDRLTHYFMEFDILDTATGAFLSTEVRRHMLEGAPVEQVLVLYEGRAQSVEHLHGLVGRSHFKSPEWRAKLEAYCVQEGLDPARVRRETDDSDTMEGLYLKVEENGRVVERYKFVRASFLNAILDSGTHWLNRPIVPNQLREAVDIYRY